MTRTAQRRLAPAVALLALSAFAFVPGVTAQDAPANEAAPATDAAAEVDPTTVLATVGGAEITEADLGFAAEDLSQELSRMPPEQRRPFLLRVLIDMKVMAGAARAEGMDQDPLFSQRVDYLADQALRREYFSEVIAASITPEAIEARYNELTADFVPEDEIRARHILVETEEEANAVIAELEGGADFAELAAERSIDPGAANGGDLGFFGQGMMVPEFEEAAFALAEPGDRSAPVQSQFGWHVIELVERRQSEPPPLAEVAPQLQQQVLIETFDAAVEDLTASTEVTILDADLQAAVEAQQAAEESAAEGAAPATGQ